MKRSEPGDLDDFYRRALVGGLAHHHAAPAAGLLPSGLVEEIRVLEHPPPPWDVQLARWFDRYFSPVETVRSYARAVPPAGVHPGHPAAGPASAGDPGQRSAPSVSCWTPPARWTSALLGKALGAIASYAAARDVPAARVVFCDAVAYDAGYLAVDEIAGRVRVRGPGRHRPAAGHQSAGDAPTTFPPTGRSWSSPTASATCCGSAATTRS